MDSVLPVLLTLSAPLVFYAATAIWAFETKLRQVLRQSSLRTQQQFTTTVTNAESANAESANAESANDGGANEESGRVLTMRQKVTKWWETPSSPGHRVFFVIFALNAIVFVLWQIPDMSKVMTHYFVQSKTSSVLALFLSSFSHWWIIHLALNMLALYSPSNAVVALVGYHNFVAVYLSAGSIAALATYTHETLATKPYSSLGASGAIMGVWGTVCSALPKLPLHCICIPKFTFPAAVFLGVMMSIDTAGLVLGWRIFDHASHLGGALFGIGYGLGGYKIAGWWQLQIMRVWGKVHPRRRFWRKLCCWRRSIQPTPIHDDLESGGASPGSGPPQCDASAKDTIKAQRFTFGRKHASSGRRSTRTMNVSGAPARKNKLKRLKSVLQPKKERVTERLDDGQHRSEVKKSRTKKMWSTFWRRRETRGGRSQNDKASLVLNESPE